MTTLNIPQPTVIQRDHGGYLAVSAPDEPIRLGVVGADEAEAREAFSRSADRWLELCAVAASREATFVDSGP